MASPRPVAMEPSQLMATHSGIYPTWASERPTYAPRSQYVPYATAGYTTAGYASARYARPQTSEPERRTTQVVDTSKREQGERERIQEYLRTNTGGLELTERTAAQELDARDELKRYRDSFYMPPSVSDDHEETIYMCGNSLGLLPKNGKRYIQEELDKWAQVGVKGHFEGERPWADIDEHDVVKEGMARVVGAERSEVVVMNTLTTNLHLMMAAFYRPSGRRVKIVIEDHAFGSDQYAVASQLESAGVDPARGLIRLKPREGEAVLRTQDIVDSIEAQGDEIALVMLSGIQYFTGQLFDIATVTRAGHAVGAKVGWDLAHAAGNAPLRLHEWGVDFACWCTYKYMNSGPGSLGGVFVHEKHTRHDSNLQYFKGWWGHDAESRFQMLDDFQPSFGAARFQLSNPPLLPMISIIASLEVFEAAGFERLRTKSERLTMYLEMILEAMMPAGSYELLTPQAPCWRGCQLSLRLKVDAKEMEELLDKRGVTVDVRRPNVVRVAPTPLYNSFADVYDFVVIFSEEILNAKEL